MAFARRIQLRSLLRKAARRNVAPVPSDGVAVAGERGSEQWGRVISCSDERDSTGQASDFLGLVDFPFL